MPDSVLDDLIERCNRAENETRAHAGAMAEAEYLRLMGKASGIALVRSYIEEALRNAS